MRYPIELRDRIYVKGYGFLSFAKNIGKKISTKKSATDAIKTTPKKAIQKITEGTGNLIGNKIADKTTSILNKRSANELPNNDETEEDVEITTHKKRYVSPEKRQQIIDELRLVAKHY